MLLEKNGCKFDKKIKKCCGVDMVCPPRVGNLITNVMVLRGGIIKIGFLIEDDWVIQGILLERDECILIRTGQAAWD